MFHDILLVQGITIIPTTPQYERNKLARVVRLKAEAAAPLALIHKIAGQLVYGENCHGKQRRKAEDGGSGSEYEPNDEEEADDADGVSGEEEQEPTIHISKAKAKQASTNPHGRKSARSKNTVPTTTRTTRASRNIRPMDPQPTHSPWTLLNPPVR